MDPDGCLTCHQYPGMVTSEDHAGIKLLHIDEDRYLQSAHGKLSCKQCHTVIEKVPHTGDTRVECTTQCHLSDAEKRKVSEVALDEFHRGEQSAIVRLDDPTSCRVCHPLYPHRQNNMVRGLLNLHTGFMVCSVCHLKREKFPDIYYDWNGTETADFIGEPFGTFYNPKLKRASKSQHFLSRISVYTRDQGERKSLMNTWDTAAAHEFKSRQKDLSPVAQKERQAFFHRDISRKEISVACDECHSKDGILDFKALGFDEHISSNLINLNIKGLVTHYKTFYFPQLFEK
ncbi:MAG: hypothetical protein P8X96_07715 [Desulfobacteraceae bacterium]